MTVVEVSPTGVAPARVAAITERERERYAAGRPLCRGAAEQGAGAFMGGVPMHWMRDWPMPFPLVVAEARGAQITDLDGHALDDFCLGDTAAMFGHSPPPVARALRQQSRAGLATMLPHETAFEAGRLLGEIFGPFRWQVATTTTDANRNALKVARAVTGRGKVLVFDGCYHGTLDETMVRRDADGTTRARPGLVAPAQDPAATTVAIDFNDLAQLETALAGGEIAAVLTEPVMTNSAMVLPRADFHAGLRALTHAHGTLLILDETHTLSSGLGGYGRVHGLAPDILVLGKAIAGGVATAVWGLAPDIALRFSAHDDRRAPGHSGMGTTLSGNPLQMACLAANLSEVMTREAYTRMERGAERLARGLSRLIADHAAPWHVVRVGARVEFICAPGPLRNGAEAAAAHAPALESAIHLALVNRGVLIAPFHNMMLVSPATRQPQIDRLILAFDEILTELFC